MDKKFKPFICPICESKVIYLTKCKNYPNTWVCKRCCEDGEKKEV